MRSGNSSTVVSPYLWAIVTGYADSPASAGVVESGVVVSVAAVTRPDPAIEATVMLIVARSAKRRRFIR